MDIITREKHSRSTRRGEKMNRSKSSKKLTNSHSEKAGRIKTKKKVVKSSSGHVRDQSADSGKKQNRPGTFVKGDPRINRTKPGPGRPRGKFARKCRKVLNNPGTWR